MSDYNDEQIAVHTIAHLASIFSLKETDHILPAERQDALWSACEIIGKALQIEMVKPVASSTPLSTHASLLAVARASQCRVRKVALKGRWWEHDNGPLLAFDQENRQPIVLLVAPSGNYMWVDSSTGEQQPLQPDHAQTLAQDGYMFYRTFPNESLTLFSLLRFVLEGQKRDIFRAAYLEGAASLLALLIPIGTGILLDNAVPNANISLLQQWLLGLLVSLFSMTLFEVIQTWVLMRLRFKTNAAIQAAVWDRLIRLPVNFFQRFSAGDLSMRASGVDSIQQSLTSATLSTTLNSIFSLFTLGLMFYYSTSLALYALGLLIILLVTMWLYAWVQLKYERIIQYLEGQLASLSLQFLTGISKLRVSHSEKRIFAVWAESFARKNRFSILSGLWGIRFTLFHGFIVLLGTLGLYGLLEMQSGQMSLGHFIAFNAAFGQFFAVALGLGSVLSTLIQLIPLYERIQPILMTLPEREKEGEDPGVLSGEIKLQSVSFRYNLDSPWALQDISLSIGAGKMVAFVGRTGCGKSTLFRLLLGFDTPNSGCILYDQQPLEQLNIRALREQFGVVLQNGTVLPGSIYETIVGSHPLTLDDAWEAVRQVNLAADIEAMLMGMHTLIAEGGKTFSTGQRQRLMIARALATHPRILFLDEATSALDNPTQRAVMKNLEERKITRVVAAHRLSTVTHADYIYVLDGGKIIQSGTYAELIAEKGLFALLVQRQLV